MSADSIPGTLHDQLNKIARDLGSLTTKAETSQSDTAKLKEGVQQLVSELAPIAEKVRLHEDEDNRRFAAVQDDTERRHRENKEHLQHIDADLLNLIADLNQRKGWRGAWKQVVATVIAFFVAVAGGIAGVMHFR